MVGLLRDHNDDDLPDLATRFRAGQQEADPFIADFLATTVYIERDVSGNGLLIHERPDHSRWVHAYSAPDWVPGSDVGQDVDYTIMTGQHLLALLPTTVGVRLDEGHSHAGDVRVPAAAPPGQSSPDSEPELVRAARAVHVGAGGRDRVLVALRNSYVFVGRTADSVPVAVLPERENWLCVFTSARLLQAELGQSSQCMVLSGGDLLDVLLPALAVIAGPIGVFVDLGADHQLSLSASLIAGSQPVSGSVESREGTSARVSRDNPGWWRR